MQSFNGIGRTAFMCCALAAAALVAPALADQPGHALADKFAAGAGGATEPQAHEDARKAEQERKRQAEQQAQEALREDARKRAEAALKAEREKQKAAGKLAPSAPKAVDPKGEESDMLARARLEDEARKAAERIRRDDESRRQLEALIKGTPAPNSQASVATGDAERADAARQHAIARMRQAVLASTRRLAAQAALDDEARRLAAASEARAKTIAEARRTWRTAAARLAQASRLEAEAREKEVAARAAEAAAAQADARAREEEKAQSEAVARRIAVVRRAYRESIARVRLAEHVQQEARAVAEPSPSLPVAVRPAENAAPPAAPKTIADAPETRPPLHITTSAEAADRLGKVVTILIVMQPGTKGIRRHNKTADPVLCLNDGCYVSTGADAPARLMSVRSTLGFANTFGDRAGACRGRLACAFRGVAVTEMPLIVTPIDMHVIRHDRRRTQAVASSSHCSFDGRRVMCLAGIYADDYAMWVVPEELAREAGPAALERALAEGLNGPRSAALFPAAR